jgi:hypothetical protein
MSTDGLTLEEAQAKLHNLRHGEQTKWYYAYAKGHGCSMATGQVDLFMAIIEQERQLTEVIRREKALRAAAGPAST